MAMREVEPDAAAQGARDEIALPAGSVIFRQGDPGDTMFIIERGRVRITLAADGQESEVAVLGSGDFFGELSLLGDAPRTATATTVEDTTLLVVRRGVFAMMMQDDLAIVFRMLYTMGERLARTDSRLRGMMDGSRRLRLLAEGLRRAGVTAGARVIVPPDKLAAEIGVETTVVRETLVELAAQGAGVLDAGGWRLDRPEHVRRLIELIAVYATGTPGGPSSG